MVFVTSSGLCPLAFIRMAFTQFHGMIHGRFDSGTVIVRFYDFKRLVLISYSFRRGYSHLCFSFLDSVITDKIDLGFAISTTALNAADTFKKMKETVKTIIRKYGVGNLRYAVIIYGSDAKVAISFDSSFPSLDNWLTTVDGMQIEQGTPAMEKALQEAKKLFEFAARSDAKKVLVVIADESPIGDEKVIKKQARDLDIDDVKVVPVAVGDDIDPIEIEDISPYKDVLVDVPKDVDPTDLAEAVMDKVLKGILSSLFIACMYFMH